MSGRRLFAVPVAAVLLSLLAAAPAMAGRLVATGHDADLHCSGGQQCGYVRTAVNWIRAGAPDPSKPVLVLDNGTQVGTALDKAFGAGVVPRTVVDPDTPAFGSTPLSPANFSAIIVASDTTCGGCDLNTSSATPESDAIKARAGDIASFFNAGGGILALAGANHGGAVPGTTGLENRYYEFVPLPLGGAPVTQPFTLTSVGTAIGFTDNPSDSDINCCATHNSFNLPPAGSALQVAETDSKGLAETLVADGTISGGGIVPPGSTTTTSSSSGSGTLPAGATGAKALPLPSSKKCTSRRAFPIRVRKYPGVRWQFATVAVNNKPVKVFVYAERRARVSRIGGIYLNSSRRFRAFVDLRGLARGTYRVRVSAITTLNQIRTNTRTYRTCSRKLAGSIPRL